MSRRLPNRFGAALKLMQSKAQLEGELSELDTSSADGEARRDALQRQIGGIYEELHSYPKEMGRITAIVYDSDDPHLTIPSLTPGMLAELLANASSKGRSA